MRINKVNVIYLPMLLMLVCPLSAVADSNTIVYVCPPIANLKTNFHSYDKVNFKGIDWLMKAIKDSKGSDYDPSLELEIYPNDFSYYRAINTYFPTMVCDGLFPMAAKGEKVVIHELRVMYGPTPEGFTCTATNSGEGPGFSCVKKQ